MARAGRTFRVFVSSTFSDLKAERDALQRHVFPRLRELCMQHGARFQAIDLRWGVSEEAGLDQQTMNLCLREVRRCREVTPRPNFIVLLGDRYGWRPLPPQIPADEFEELAGLVTDAADGELLQQWYRRDDNAVPPEYVLQPRTGRQTDPDVWSQTEGALRTVFARALAAAGWAADDPRRVKYGASATEQEILAGALFDETETDHAFCYLRTIADMPPDAPEAAVFRETDPEATRRLEAIKQRLREHSPADQVCEYAANWSGDELGEDHLPALCKRVAADLERAIVAELAYIERQSPLQLEVDAHRAFSEDRARHFIGRRNAVEQIREYVRRQAGHPLVVYGPSGCGKSALIAYCEQMARRSSGAVVVSRFVGATPASGDIRSLLENVCVELAAEYNDLRPVPADPRELVTHFRELLALADRERPLIIFLDALDQLSSSDAAHSLDWLPRELPPAVRIVVSVLERDDDAGACLRAARAKLPSEWLVPIKPLLPEEGEQLLDIWLGEAGRALRQEQREDVLGKFAGCPLPLFLKLAFEETRHWRSYDGLPCGGDPEPGVGRDIPGVIADLLVRLEAPANHGAVIVSKSLAYLTAARNGLSEDEALDVLSADAEAMEDFRLRSPRSPKVGRLPVVVWARLFHDLEPYLTERMADGTSLMTFYHRQVGEAVRARYLTETTMRQAHQALARHFRNQPHRAERPGGEEAPNLRQYAELPYQLTLGAMWKELLATLTAYRFLDAKLRAVGVHDLIGDYERAYRGKSGLPAAEAHSMKLIGDALTLSSHVLPHDPDQLPSQLFGRLVESDDVAVQALLSSVRSTVRRPWLRPLTASLAAPGGPLRRTMTGHRSGIRAVAMTADGRRALSASEDATLKVWDLETGAELRTLTGHAGAVTAVAITPDGRLAISASRDGTLKVWSLQAGTELYTLAGHGSGVNAVALTHEGRMAVSASSDKTLKVWDLEIGAEVRTITGHEEPVTCLAVSANGSQAVSACGYQKALTVWDLDTGERVRDLSLRANVVEVTALVALPDGPRVLSACSTWASGPRLDLWDLDTGAQPRTMTGHGGKVSALAATGDGRRVISASEDRTLKVWDLETGAELRTLPGHSLAAKAVAVTPDGRRAVSAGEHPGSTGELKVWDLRTEPRPRNVGAHTQAVSAVVVTPDGRHAVSASDDQTLKVWSLAQGAQLHALTGHTDSVRALAATPDGRRVISGSRDRTLKVWDVASGTQLHTLAGHSREVRAVAMTADGRRAISTSEEMTLKVWDVDTGAELHTLFGHSRGVKCVAMAPDCRRALSASADGTVKVWDLDTGAELRTLTGHPGYVHALAVTQDGRRAVSASSGQALKVWELDTGAELSTLSGWSAPAAGVAVTPYYLQIVDDRGTGGLRVWNPLPAVDVYTIRGDTGPIAAVACTPDGRLAVSASSDQRLRVWDVASAEALCTFRAESGLSACATAPDGVTCVAGDEGGGLHLLRMENVPAGPTLCTAWLSASGEAPAFGCLHCRVWSEVSEEDLGTELPCPNCGKAAKLNPFTVDADWRPVAATWSGLPGTRRETPLSPTPGCQGQSTPAPRIPQPVSAHLERLRADHECIAREFSDHPKITVTPLHGDPPDIYEVTYNIVGLELDVITVRPRKRSQHKVRFYLHSAYPEEMPKCVVETPIFHPNLTSLGCVDDSAPWTPETGLVDLVVHIGRMIAYQRYDVRFPMDAVAARWAETNANLFPIDDSDIAGLSATPGVAPE